MDWLVDIFEKLVGFVGDETRQGALTIIGGSIAAVFVAAWAIFRHFRDSKPAAAPDAEISHLRVSLDEYHVQLSSQVAQLTAEISRSPDNERIQLVSRKEELERRLEDIEASYIDAQRKAEELEAALLTATQHISTDRIDEALSDIHQGKLQQASDVLESVIADLQPYLQRASVAAYGLGLVAEEKADWEQAAQHFTESLGYLENDANVHKATVYLMRTGNFSGAVITSKKLLELTIARYGRVHTNTAGVLNNLAASLYECGRQDEAISRLQESLEIKRLLGEQDDEQYAASITNLANMHLIQGKFAIAEKLHRDALDIISRVAPSDPIKKAAMANGLAECLRLNKKFDESESLFRDNMVNCVTEFGEDSAEFCRCLNFLAKVLTETGRIDEAINSWQKSLSLSQKHNGIYHPYTLSIANNLMAACKGRGSDSDLKIVKEIEELYDDQEIH